MIFLIELVSFPVLCLLCSEVVKFCKAFWGIGSYTWLCSGITTLLCSGITAGYSQTNCGVRDWIQIRNAKSILPVVLMCNTSVYVIHEIQKPLSLIWFYLSVFSFLLLFFWLVIYSNKLLRPKCHKVCPLYFGCYSWGGGSHAVIFRGKNWLCTQELLLLGSGDHTGCLRLNYGQARQVPHPLFGPEFCFFFWPYE